MQTQAGDQTQVVKEEKQIRSVFVGNIPYETNEEELKAIFSRIGPVVSFRIMYDRDTGKPKGYGFCEYRDVETAQSAIRNLNSLEIHSRTLRVDSAVNEKCKDDMRDFKAADIPQTGPTPPLDFGCEDVSKIISSIPMEQLFELVKQMKVCVQNNPDESRELLIQNPQLGFALMEALLMLKIIDPKTSNDLLLNHPSLKVSQNKQPPVSQINLNTQHVLEPPRSLNPPFYNDDDFNPDVQREFDLMQRQDIRPPANYAPLSSSYHNYPGFNDRYPSEKIKQPKSYFKDPKADISYQNDPEYLERGDKDYQRAPVRGKAMLEKREPDYYVDERMKPDFKQSPHNEYNYDHERYQSQIGYHAREPRDVIGGANQSTHRRDPRMSKGYEKDSRRPTSPRDNIAYPDPRYQKQMNMASDPRIPPHKPIKDEMHYSRDREIDRDYIHQGGSHQSSSTERSSRFSSQRYHQNDRNLKY